MTRAQTRAAAGTTSCQSSCKRRSRFIGCLNYGEEMTMRRLPVAVRRIALMAFANVLSLGIASQAAADVVTNFGGPILGATGHPWTIAPLYVGSNWGSATSTAVLDHQRFLTNLADYVSGTYLPP